MGGLRGAIREALTETLGPPPPDPLGDMFTDLSSAIRQIATCPEPDMEKLAAQEQPMLLQAQLDRCTVACRRLQQFRRALQRRLIHAA